MSPSLFALGLGPQTPLQVRVLRCSLAHALPAPYGAEWCARLLGASTKGLWRRSGSVLFFKVQWSCFWFWRVGRVGWGQMFCSWSSKQRSVKGNGQTEMRFQTFRVLTVVPTCTNHWAGCWFDELVLDLWYAFRGWKPPRAWGGTSLVWRQPASVIRSTNCTRWPTTMWSFSGKILAITISVWAEGSQVMSSLCQIWKFVWCWGLLLTSAESGSPSPIQ